MSSSAIFVLDVKGKVSLNAFEMQISEKQS